MFPEVFVRWNVLAWSKRDDVVFDPFSGRGTTLFDSLLNGRKGIGWDTNPVAVCLSKAKADPPARRFAAKAPELEDEFFTLCFHGSTLQLLLFLMRKLD